MPSAYTVPSRLLLLSRASSQVLAGVLRRGQAASRGLLDGRSRQTASGRSCGFHWGPTRTRSGSGGGGLDILLDLLLDLSLAIVLRALEGDHPSQGHCNDGVGRCDLADGPKSRVGQDISLAWKSGDDGEAWTNAGGDRKREWTSQSQSKRRNRGRSQSQAVATILASSLG